MFSLKFCGRPLVAIASYDAHQVKPVEPMTLIEQREYTMPSVKKLHNGKMVLVVRRHAEEGATKDAEKPRGNLNGAKNGKGDAKAAGDGGKGGNGKKDEKKADGGDGKAEKKDGGGDAKNDGGEEFTAEQDKMILDMKADGKTWAEIGAALGGKSKSTATNRWKQLTKDGGAGAAEKKDEPNKEDGKGKAAAGKKDDNKSGDKKQAAVPTKVPSSKHGSDVRFTKGEWTTLMEDDMFSFGELQCMSELLVQDERHRWLRVASRFADKTGRKVHPDDIREKFAEMGNMRR